MFRTILESAKNLQIANHVSAEAFAEETPVEEFIYRNRKGSPFDGQKFKIIEKSRKSHLFPPDGAPIGVFVTGFEAQYVAVSEDGHPAEVYIYFYKKFEGGGRGIVDSIEIYEKQELK